MITDDYKVEDILAAIDPAATTYQEWCNVGMALKKGGYPCSVWEDWSRRDMARYHPGECEKKWASFRGSLHDVSMGTIVHMAMEQGFRPDHNDDYTIITEANDYYDTSSVRFIDQRWVQEEEVPGPVNFNPCQQIITYLETLFQSDEYVGYVTEAYKKDDDSGRYLPKKGPHKRTAGDLISALYACGGDVGQVLGELNDEYGAWIRFNPLDGEGVSDSNVTVFRYALVESDSLPINKQYALIKQLELPVVLLVHSGGKSLHAICRVDAGSFAEYRSRVDYLYKVCESNGLKLDTNNRNPSRLSRLPGATRNGKPQYIVADHIGQENYEKWKEFIEATNDNLPDEDQLSDWLFNPPALAPELISGVLRKGHKMLLSGPSKAGKSFALIELCIAIAEGQQWLGFNCAQGHVLYVNLELDRNSCLRRFCDVYRAMDIAQPHPSNITIWNLRGKSEPMDKLAPKLIRRAKECGYVAIIIDPIYKIITGDENSADQMAAFCNEFDRVATELGCAVIYCHHHSKGAQAGKRASDRASGSGVFSRDPDAILDMLDIPLKDDDLDALSAHVRAEAALQSMKKLIHPDNFLQILDGVDISNGSAIMDAARGHLPGFLCAKIQNDVKRAEEQIERMTAWRIEGTLREFPSFRPMYLWFRYPIHIADTTGILSRKGQEWGAPSARQKGMDAMKEKRQKQFEADRDSWAIAMESTGGDAKKMYEYYSEIADSTVRRRAAKFGYHLQGGKFVQADS